MKKTKINKKGVWNLSPLYKSDNDPQIARNMELVKKANYRFINKWKKRTDYLKEPKVLRQALDESEKLSATYGLTGKFGYYFWLRSSQEEDNAKLKGWCNKISDFAVKIENDSQF